MLRQDYLRLRLYQVQAQVTLKSYIPHLEILDFENAQVRQEKGSLLSQMYPSQYGKLNLVCIQKIASRLCKTVCKDRWMGPFLKNGGWGYNGGSFWKCVKGYPSYI